MTGAGTMRRWIKVAVAAAAVVGLGGYMAEPYAQDWWLVGRACDGALPRDSVAQLTPDDAQFTKEESRRIPELGFYGCSLAFDGDDTEGVFLVAMSAYTGRDDQDREFKRAFPEGGFTPNAVLSGGLPGTVDDAGVMRIVTQCPALGKDAEGRQRKMLVRVGTFGDVDRSALGAVYRTAVALANSASKILSCGARPLKVPHRITGFDTEERWRRAVSPAKAEGTGCDWLARAGLAKSEGWRLAAEANDTAPTSVCDLRMERGDGAGRAGMEFGAWYGDWSSRLTASDDNGERRPLTATARCDGEAANFALDATKDTPGVDKAERRRLLKAFAEDQVRRRGCSGLRFF
ncbi:MULTISPECIES: hypothetical protein [unclassified Streptomyces]|uniref:hypothetical protein n=1 Tax=unclassified Streptomyces TaxID=2593676 RepID=UPI002DDC5204|nr:hypothetical protein [Streptomyces sp. NBC_01445]WSE02881.1 hypothetical protein OG574_05450 [Streptomyces sp. NBC_01445]